MKFLFHSMNIREERKRKYLLKYEATIYPSMQNLPVRIIAKVTIHSQNLATALIEESHSSQNAVKQYPEQFPHAEDVAWYFADTLGETNQDVENVQTNFAESFMRFKALRDDYPVDLLAGEKDEICRGMCKQEHCGLRRFTLRPDGTVEHDTNYLSVFLHESIRLGVAEDIKITKQSVSFTNAPDEIVEGLRVNAGVVKYVLQNSFDKWDRLSEPGIVRKRSF